MLSFNLPKWSLFFILWSGFVLQVLAKRKVRDKNVCRTLGCQVSATIFNRNMDRSVNPCDDFYHFACGNYVTKENVGHKLKLSAFFTVENFVTILLRKIINTPEQINEPRHFKMVKRLYKICIRQDLMEARGVGVVLGMLRKAGGWPVLEGDKWDESKFDWVDTVYKLHDLNLSGQLFDVSVITDLMNSTKRVIKVDQIISLGLPRDTLIKGRQDEMVRHYLIYMVDIACLFGSGIQFAVKEFSDVLNFEIEIAKIAVSNKDRRDIYKFYNVMEVQELQARHPIVLWEEYMGRLFNNITKVNPEEIIIVPVPSYFDKLQELLQRTDKRTIANFMFWKAVTGTLTFLSKAVRARQMKYYKLVSGRRKRMNRWKECIDTIKSGLSLAVGAMYVHTVSRKFDKRHANNMVESINQELLKSLKTVDWMDEDTRGLAIDKANAMLKHVAYPNELLEDEKLEKFYEKLEVTGETFFESILNITKFNYDYTISLLREPINRSDWRTHGFVTDVNAFYNPTENSLNLPAGIWQNIFYSKSRPMCINYGSIGNIIGHEITHGFDNLGNQFDKTGSYRYWWLPKTGEQFNTRTKCAIEQANNYTVESVNMKLNGINALIESVADSGGIRLSYRAYNSWKAEHGQEQIVAGLEEYTSRQLFWLSAANVWCTVYNKTDLKSQITNGYAPAEYKVNGAFRNQEAFAKDFQCPIGSYMNPVHKCNVW